MAAGDGDILGTVFDFFMGMSTGQIEGAKVAFDVSGPPIPGDVYTNYDGRYHQFVRCNNYDYEVTVSKDGFITDVDTVFAPFDPYCQIEHDVGLSPIIATGTVRDINTQDPVQGAAVWIMTSGHSPNDPESIWAEAAETNADGLYEFTLPGIGLGSGVYYMQAIKTGYYDALGNLFALSDASQPNPVNFYLVAE